VLSIGTITAGDGYKYLTKEVVSGAEDYYLRAGVDASEAQGWWLGTQREAFGVDGGVVSEEQLAAFFGTKTDPATGEPLGSKFRVYASVAERLERAAADHQALVTQDLAVRAAALKATGGGEERQADSLVAHKVAAEERWNKTRQKIERAGERNSVAGYDLTFSAPESVSVLWASAPHQVEQQSLHAVHSVGAYHAGEVVGAVAVLPGRYVGPAVVPDLPETGDVIGGHRLLEPRHTVVLVEGPTHPHRLFAGVTPVGVHLQIQIVAGDLAGQRHPAQVPPCIGAPGLDDLDLHPRDPPTHDPPLELSPSRGLVVGGKAAAAVYWNWIQLRLPWVSHCR
jgi:TrwC relaxase